ncbi:MAG: transglycosylase domain-containing protein [Oscillospiraceae bacterium]|nr:transglycosylase domain-containing protein [Oscillospiraceae bacterium]
MSRSAGAAPHREVKRSYLLSFFQIIKSFFSVIGKIFLTFMMVMIITGSIVAIVMAVSILELVDTNELVDINPDNVNYTTFMYTLTPDGEISPKESDTLRIHGSENRIPVKIEDISKFMQDAVVAIEDKRFYEHPGVDFYRTIGAGINWFIPIWSSRQGASTIDQQLIKNLTGRKEERVERKVQEIFSALNVDKHYTKQEILEAYLNTIPLGHNTNGVQAAANFYFDKDAIDLTLAESACLAGITKAPTYYDPVKNPANNKERQEQILDAMLEQELITQSQRDQALAEKLEIKAELYTEQEDYKAKYSYAQEYVMDQVIDDLQTELGYTEARAKHMFFNGGLRVYTTIDTDIQASIEYVFANYDTFFRPYIANEAPVQGAMVVTDPTGKILGMVGGMGTKDVDRGHNRATMTRRHPGSSMKPVSVYGPAIELNKITYSTVFYDKELNIPQGDGTYWSPKNEYMRYDGPMTVDMALRRSVNTVAVQVEQLVTPEYSFNFLKNSLGVNLTERIYIGNKVKSDIGLAPMTLGALTYGVTPLEWAGAYQMYANGGYYTKPYSYTKVLDSEGNLILEKNKTAVPVIGEDTAMIMNRLMQNIVYKDRGTGRFAQNLAGVTVAGKTGTSNSSNDQWFVGLTPDYVGVVWLGYDYLRTVIYPGLYPPPTVWTNVMKEIYSRKPQTEARSFPTSANVVEKRYCLHTGKLAGEFCTETDIGYYKKDNLPPVCTPEDHKALVSSSEESSSGVSSETSSGAGESEGQESGSSSQESGGASGDSSEESNFIWPEQSAQEPPAYETPQESQTPETPPSAETSPSETQSTETSPAEESLAD